MVNVIAPPKSIVSEEPTIETPTLQPPGQYTRKQAVDAIVVETGYSRLLALITLWWIGLLVQRIRHAHEPVIISWLERRLPMYKLFNQLVPHGDTAPVEGSASAIVQAVVLDRANGEMVLSHYDEHEPRMRRGRDTCYTNIVRRAEIVAVDCAA